VACISVSTHQDDSQSPHWTPWRSQSHSRIWSTSKSTPVAVPFQQQRYQTYGHYVRSCISDLWDHQAPLAKGKHSRSSLIASSCNQTCCLQCTSCHLWATFEVWRPSLNIRFEEKCLHEQRLLLIVDRKGRRRLLGIVAIVRPRSNIIRILNAIKYPCLRLCGICRNICWFFSYCCINNLPLSFLLF